MGDDAEYGQPEGEAVDDHEQDLQAHDAIDQPGEESLRENRVLLHKL
jgi:hypothetical protein